MRKPIARLLAGAAAGVALTCLSGGVAHAETTPVWLLPGVDAGAVLGPTAELPAQALRPVFDAIPAGAVPGGVVPGGVSAPAQGQAQAAAPADGPAIVDEPDTSGLHNKWTFAPAGVPVLGVIDSVQGVPGRLF
ncbi:hypothetical protein A8924_6251 [Saccharopolyspora erythraea NRRL 2338]|uniref:Uncharacterized protein n=2 Tax=Saccharopolyspora erythraea TaxID=1836 RepID=A4FM16_SACEN|nr:hypothetical protein [Saccharopolyspora erythraea]EQD88269.1 hypothetical protein N599_00605 [Saccharopolyspora erythraea D]PFG98729.1 hypothetical protein A8924_6251 [Saccharopolyspora erythraea NRRL 2338]QRK88737.1 hypothetical protein JQX30_29590 [Saccharopolyspora erythraea]CAM05091.1 hypothetical protein SACE_5908 [Saccharopolyspora erythraea NRRL 2338]